MDGAVAQLLAVDFAAGQLSGHAVLFVHHVEEFVEILGHRSLLTTESTEHTEELATECAGGTKITRHFFVLFALFVAKLL